MSRIKKRFQRLLQGSKDIKWDETQTILRHYGCMIEKPNGSHWVVYCPDKPDAGQLTVPVHGNRIKPIYVKRIIRFLEEILEEEGE